MCHGFPFTSETFVTNMVTGLIDRGHAVDIYSLQPGFEPQEVGHPDIAAYELLDRTTTIPTFPRGGLRRLAKVGRIIWKQRGHQLPALVRSLNVFRYKRYGVTLRLFLRAVPMLERGLYDVVHCQFGTVGLEVLPLRRLGALQGRLAVSIRGYDISGFLAKRGGRAYDRLFREADIFLSTSQFFSRRLIQLDCPKDKVRVYHSGISCQRFEFSPPHFPTRGPLRLLSVGRLVEKKGIRYSIEALAQLDGLGRDIEYLIVGDGPRRGQLEQLAADLGVSRKVKFLGRRPHGEIPDLLKDAHIFVGPSVTAVGGDQDGPINTLKEAMATGLPVIATRHGGIPELVEDGVSGFLVPERDPAAIAEKVRTLVQNPEIWPAMGLVGRTRVEQDFDLNRLNDDLVEIYRNLS